MSNGILNKDVLDAARKAVVMKYDHVDSDLLHKALNSSTSLLGKPEVAKKSKGKKYSDYVGKREFMEKLNSVMRELKNKTHQIWSVPLNSMCGYMASKNILMELMKEDVDGLYHKEIQAKINEIDKKLESYSYFIDNVEYGEKKSDR